MSSKKLLIFFTLLGLGFPSFTYAQQAITPTLYCLGNCLMPSPSLKPTTTQRIIPTATVSSINRQSVAVPNATVVPCSSENANQVFTKNKQRHKDRGGLIEQLIQLLMKLIAALLQPGRGQPILPGTPTPIPTQPITPTVPVANPCVPTLVPPASGGGVPSVVPSVALSAAPTLTISAPQPTLTTNTACTNPIWQSAEPNGMYETNGYFIHNNMWNTSYNPGPQTTFVCGYNNWYVTSTQTNTQGAVKTYPNVHKDFNNLNGTPFSSFNTITSTFAATAPRVGIYNVAYDLWLNGVGWGGGSTEYMIWTENFGQTPLGSKQATVTFAGQAFDAYYYNDGDANVVSLVATSTMNAGSLNLKEMITWGISKGWIPANPTVNQIGFGVEVVSTNGAPATFTFTNFSVVAN